MLFGVLLTIHILVCIALVGVILLQRSEGGALGMGGGPSGFMTARGAGNLLTQATSVLGGAFFVLSLALTLLAGGRSASSVTDRLDIQGIDPSTLNQAAPTAPATGGLPTAPVPGPGGAIPPAQTIPAAPPVLEAPRPTTSAPATESTAPAQ